MEDELDCMVHVQTKYRHHEALYEITAINTHIGTSREEVSFSIRNDR